MEITFAIVGTAGREEDEKRLSKKHFEAMCIVASELVDHFKSINYPITHLISGGAAWADHVAVHLFLEKKVEHLRLFLPCEFSYGSFHDNGEREKHKNPGGILNLYHKKFQNTTHINSLSQIQIAKHEGAELLPCRGGFIGRNAMVAKSDFILACTFGEGKLLKDGGTANTVAAYLKRVKKEGFFDKSFHYDLNSGQIYIGCEVLDQEQMKRKKEKELKKKHRQIYGMSFHQLAGIS